MDKKSVDRVLAAWRSTIGYNHVVLVAIGAIFTGQWGRLFLFEIEVHSFGICWGYTLFRRSGRNDIEIEVLGAVLAGDGLELLSHDIHRCSLLIFALILLVFPKALHDIFMRDQIIQTRFSDRVSIVSDDVICLDDNLLVIWILVFIDLNV